MASPPSSPPSLNLAVLAGVLSSDPTTRELPGGQRAYTYDVITRVADGSAAPAPVTWVDPPSAPPALERGDEVVVVGHVRRRFFTAGGATQSRTEVVASTVVPARQRAKVRRAVQLATAQLAGALDRGG